MPLNDWKTKTSSWITNTINGLDTEDEGIDTSKDSELLTGISIGPYAELKSGASNTYDDIYQNLKRINTKRMDTVLNLELHSVSELNKAERIDLILEGKGPVVLNPEYVKPNITLGNHEIESDEDFEMMWANFDPWDELGSETNFDVRLIPRS